MESMDYLALSQLTEAYRDVDSASYLHGGTCGLLCAQKRLDFDFWALKMLGDPYMDDELKESFEKFVKEVFDSLNSPSLELDLMLPDEDEPIWIRADALGQWCTGFIFGMAEGGALTPEKMSGTLGEMMQDLTQIAQQTTNVEYDEDEIEDDESDLFEISEYVRVAVMTMNEELNPIAPKPIVETSEQVH